MSARDPRELLILADRFADQYEASGHDGDGGPFALRTAKVIRDLAAALAPLCNVLPDGEYANVALVALRACQEMLDKHDLWCGHKEGSPGDASFNRAERLIRKAMTALEAYPGAASPAPAPSHATADWHGPLAAAERRVAELEALVLEYQEAERALSVARCVDDGESDDIRRLRNIRAAAEAALLAWRPR